MTPGNVTKSVKYYPKQEWKSEETIVLLMLLSQGNNIQTKSFPDRMFAILSERKAIHPLMTKPERKSFI